MCSYSFNLCDECVCSYIIFLIAGKYTEQVEQIQMENLLEVDKEVEKEVEEKAEKEVERKALAGQRMVI